MSVSQIFGGESPLACLYEFGSRHHLSAVVGPIYIKPLRSNQTSTLCAGSFNKLSLGCSLELTTDCIRDVVLHFSPTSFSLALSPSLSPPFPCAFFHHPCSFSTAQRHIAHLSSGFIPSFCPFIIPFCLLLSFS